MTHSELCKLALNWLKRPNSRNGPGCVVALSECRTGFRCEVPDAIGFRTSDKQISSILVEVKTSRADFLADINKPHRHSGGVGDWRYYLAPEGLISIDELPDKWGLLEVNKRGHIKVISGLALYYSNWGQMIKNIDAWRFVDVDREREQYLLIRTLANIDPQKKLDKIREASKLYRDAKQGIERMSVALGLPKDADPYQAECAVNLLMQELNKSKK